MVDQTRERLLLDPAGLLLRHALDPEAGIVDFVLLAQRSEDGIEQVVAGRRGVDHDQLAQIGVDPVLQREIHQHRPGQRALPRPGRRGNELAALVVEEQKKDLFGERQHDAHLRLGATHGPGPLPGPLCTTTGFAAEADRPRRCAGADSMTAGHRVARRRRPLRKGGAPCRVALRPADGRIVTVRSGHGRMPTLSRPPTAAPRR